jgi:hypothetical protein
VVFSALVARPVLAVRQQGVQVVAADVVLCKIETVIVRLCSPW